MISRLAKYDKKQVFVVFGAHLEKVATALALQWRLDFQIYLCDP